MTRGVRRSSVTIGEKKSHSCQLRLENFNMSSEFLCDTSPISRKKSRKKNNSMENIIPSFKIFFLSFVLCVQAHVCPCMMLMCKCACVCACAGQKADFNVIPLAPSAFLLFWARVSLETCQVRLGWLTRMPQDSPCFYFPSAGIMNLCLHAWFIFFKYGFWESNSGLCGYKVNPLLNDSPPQSSSNVSNTGGRSDEEETAWCCDSSYV